MAAMSLASCAMPGSAPAPPIPPPAVRGLPPAEKAAQFERGLDARHLLSWGALAYAVRLPAAGEGPCVPL